MSLEYLLNTPPASVVSPRNHLAMPAASKPSPSTSTTATTSSSASSGSQSRGTMKSKGKNKRRNPPLSPSPSFYLPSAQAVRRPLSPSPSLPIPNRPQKQSSGGQGGALGGSVAGGIYRPPTPRSYSSPNGTSPSSPSRSPAPGPAPPRRPSVSGATMDYSLSMAEILALSPRPYSPYAPYPPNDPQYTLAVHYEPLAGMPFSKVQLEPPAPRPNSPVPSAIGPIGPAGEHVRIWTPQPRRLPSHSPHPVPTPGHGPRRGPPRPATRRSFSTPPTRPLLSRAATTPGPDGKPSREGRGFGEHSRLPSTDSITFFPLLDSDNDPPDQSTTSGEDEHAQCGSNSARGDEHGKHSFFATLRSLTWRSTPRTQANGKRARDETEKETHLVVPPNSPVKPGGTLPSMPLMPVSRPQSPGLDYTQAQRQAITLLADRPAASHENPERRYKSPATTGLTLARTISLGRAEFEMGDRAISPGPRTGAEPPDESPWLDTMAESTHSV